MSPQSRGRRRKPSRAPRTGDSRPPARVSTLLLKDLRKVETFASAVIAESWASTYVGVAWARAALGDDLAETTMGLEVVAGVLDRPTRAGLAGVQALRRIAQPADWEPLDACIAALSRTFPPPAWATAPTATPVAAWRTEDVWLSSRALFVDFEDETGAGHTLMLQATTPGGVMVGVLDILPRDSVASWDGLVEEGSGVMPLQPHPIEDALAEMAGLMATTDRYWPRYASHEYTAFRALFWSRCRDHLSTRRVRPPEVDRKALLADFVQLPAVQDLDDEIVGSLTDLFLDFGEDHIDAGPLAWSPDHVSAFLVDWLPRNAPLDADHRKDLPDVLRAWTRFALEHRGLEERWIVSVEQAIDQSLPGFHEAFDDFEAWKQAQQIADELLARGVDPSDRASVEAGLDGYDVDPDPPSPADA